MFPLNILKSNHTVNPHVWENKWALSISNKVSFVYFFYNVKLNNKNYYTRHLLSWEIKEKKKKKSLYCPTFKSHLLFTVWFINYISFLIFRGLCSLNVNEYMYFSFFWKWVFAVRLLSLRKKKNQHFYKTFHFRSISLVWLYCCAFCGHSSPTH